MRSILARLANAAQPEYLATLVVSFPQGVDRYQKGFNGVFEALSQQELISEMQLLLETPGTGQNDLPQ